jgi:hypothetical protein
LSTGWNEPRCCDHRSGTSRRNACHVVLHRSQYGSFAAPLEHEALLAIHPQVLFLIPAEQRNGL